jgi:hypothetical protein
MHQHKMENVVFNYMIHTECTAQRILGQLYSYNTDNEDAKNKHALYKSILSG